MGKNYDDAMWVRHLLAIVILPFTVAVLIPLRIAQRYGLSPGVGDSAAEIALQLVGVASGGVGLVLFAASLRRFVTEGRGTLAPWDPPRALVVRGPYRFVRNPMISGVVFVLFAEALVLLSRPHGLWAAAFLILNLIYIPLVEEPQLEHRFGDAYREYCRHVRRIWPRLRPWSGQGVAASGPDGGGTAGGAGSPANDHGAAASDQR
jgi:protein-S-isoprenylcysteine O-methyltransferase Ste14